MKPQDFNLKDASPHCDEEFYIAIDGGGTKTEFVLFKSDGSVELTVVRGTSNPNSCGVDGALEVLRDGIDHLLTCKKTPKRIFAGISGSMVGEHRKTIRSFLQNAYPFCKIDVDSDIRNIIGLTRHNNKCIAAIIGTGSVVYGWDGKGLKRIGGWGYLIDDAGSGYDIGREVLLAAYAYADGLAPLSEVVRLTEIKLGGPVTDHTSKLYSEGRAYIASFCPIAFEAMEKGDKLAEKIITTSAARFANLINHMYSLGEYGNHVVISGGLALNSKIMVGIIEKELDSGITVELPTLPPIMGAMRTCMELDGIDVDYDNFKSRFAESYNQK